MNKRLWLLSAFVLAAIAQLAVPAWMIRQHELTLREGQVFLFRTSPVDPIDAFRGRFVWLGLEPATVKPPKVNDWTRGQKAYAVLGTDTNGFATVLRLERDRPADEPAIAV
ncbi:MAG TPA: GDYXXLXY domain-containing protein, partial [Kiritimatiellia bacterium]|nr:GDYXXLXY domain-containing protein [Kiritimatiellia bacterium]